MTDKDNSKRRKSRKSSSKRSFEMRETVYTNSGVDGQGGETLMYSGVQPLGQAPQAVPYMDDDPFNTTKFKPQEEVRPVEEVFNPVPEPMPIPMESAPVPEPEPEKDSGPTIIQTPQQAPQPNINVSITQPAMQQMPMMQPQPLIHNIAMPMAGQAPPYQQVQPMMQQHMQPMQPMMYNQQQNAPLIANQAQPQVATDNVQQSAPTEPILEDDESSSGESETQQLVPKTAEEPIIQSDSDSDSDSDDPIDRASMSSTPPLE